MGSAETALGDYESALEHLLVARADMDRPGPTCVWYWRMPLEWALTELWLAKGDPAEARPQADRFLAMTLATAERTYQGLAWEVSARVAMAAEEWGRAEECITSALSTMDGYEVPLAAWRVHGTAAELFARAGSNGLAEHHQELSRATILKLANSLAAEDPLRKTFLSAPAIRKVLAAPEDVLRQQAKA
jgi:hypothetical protein